MAYTTRRFVLCLTLCHFVLVFFSPFSITITSLGEERAKLSAFRTFIRFVLVWIYRFPLPLGVWEGLRFMIVALPGLFSYLLLTISEVRAEVKMNTSTSLYLVILDSKTAFDVVNHIILLGKLYDMGIHPALWSIVNYIYLGLTSKMKWLDGLSDSFEIN